MSKVAYRPMAVLERAQPSDSRLVSNSAKLLGAASIFVAVFALFGVVAICSNGFSAFTPRKLRPKESTELPAFQATKVSPTTASDQDNGIGMLAHDANQALQGAIASDHAVLDQATAPAAITTAPAAPVAQPLQPEQAESKLSAKDSALLEASPSNAAQNDTERELPKGVRKKLERDRRETERKRSRLEEAYQRHGISGEAYRKGVEKYRSEIERYRRQMNGGGPKNEPGF